MNIKDDKPSILNACLPQLVLLLIDGFLDSYSFTSTSLFLDDFLYSHNFPT